MRAVFLLAAGLLLASCGRDNSDRLDDSQIAEASQGKSPGADNRCAAAATHEAIKRDLFRRAAEIRGSNAANYDRIAGFALLTVDEAAPVEAVGPGAEVVCKGRAMLRLPPNLTVAGGRTSLSGTIGYTVGAAAAGAAPIVTVTSADAITIPLATLTQQRAKPAIAPPAAPPPTTAPRPVGPENAAAASTPSFDCRRARAQSEYAVCASPALSELDRAMAARYRAAVTAADPAQVRLLTETRDRFLAFRNRCGDDDCIAQTYRGRMREIDDIVAGRWQRPR